MSDQSFQALVEYRESLLLAEIGALLHNIGKLSVEFIGKQTGGSENNDEFDYEVIAGVIRHLLDAPPINGKVNDCQFTRKFPSLKQNYDKRSRASINARFLDDETKTLLQDRSLHLPEPFNDHLYALGDLIEFQANGWYSQKQAPRRIEAFFPTSWATMLLQKSHHAASGGEKSAAIPELNSDSDEGHQSEDSLPASSADRPSPTRPIHTQQQSFGAISVASAFGAERQVKLDLLVYLREAFLRILRGAKGEDIGANRTKLLAAAEAILSCGVGDTQRPINDITIWDLGSAAAALWKAGAAKFIISQASTSAALCGEDLSENKIAWRLLSARFDGLGFLSHAHHVTDLLGRHRVLVESLDRLASVLERDYPLGNQVYRDENGSIFIIPDIEQILEYSVPESKNTLDEHLRATFDGIFQEEMDGEIEIALKPSLPAKGERLHLGRVLSPPPSLSARPSSAQRWWANSKATEICTVCRVRPQGWGAKTKHQTDISFARNICGVCLERRGRRSKQWIENDLSKTTIWIDETSDKNGVVALVVGRFDLAGWVNGDMIKTLSVGTPENPQEKNPSFARIRRVVDTTRQFWLDTQNSLSLATGRNGIRLRLEGMISSPVSNRLDRFNAYELNIKGRLLSAVFEGAEGHKKDDQECTGSFVTADNLKYFAKLLDLEDTDKMSESDAATAIKALIHGSLVVTEPGGYGQQRREIGSIRIDQEKQVRVLDRQSYIPAIPLLAEPRSFMAIVPADRALKLVEQIAYRYEQEMGRVRDRLRLDVGVVYFKRRVPLPSVLDAGRRMLEMTKSGYEECWTVATNRLSPSGREREIAFTNGETWRYPVYMGDGATEDIWYPFMRATRNEQDIGVVHVRHLRPCDRVKVRPSHFDWDYLEDSGQRVRVAYDEDGRREDAQYRHRPLFLDDAAKLGRVWRLLPGVAGGKPATTQIRQSIELIEAKREEWRVEPGNAAESVFQTFVAEVLGNLGEGWWPQLQQDERDLLLSAAVHGLLTDAVEIYQSVAPPEETSAKRQAEELEGGKS